MQGNINQSTYSFVNFATWAGLKICATNKKKIDEYLFMDLIKQRPVKYSLK